MKDIEKRRKLIAENAKISEKDKHDAKMKRDAIAAAKNYMPSFKKQPCWYTPPPAKWEFFSSTDMTTNSTGLFGNKYIPNLNPPLDLEVSSSQKIFTSKKPDMSEFEKCAVKTSFAKMMREMAGRAPIAPGPRPFSVNSIVEPTYTEFHDFHTPRFEPPTEEQVAMLNRKKKKYPVLKCNDCTFRTRAISHLKKHKKFVHQK